MPKRTKQELAERKAAAAEIAAMYNTVANGGKMERKIGPDWVESDGPDLGWNLSYFRVIPAKKKKATPAKKKP